MRRSAGMTSRRCRSLSAQPRREASGRFFFSKAPFFPRRPFLPARSSTLVHQYILTLRYRYTAMVKAVGTSSCGLLAPDSASHVEEFVNALRIARGAHPRRFTPACVAHRHSCVNGNSCRTVAVSPRSVRRDRPSVNFDSKIRFEARRPRWVRAGEGRIGRVP